ncbi:MAG: DNA methyltransferase [archaeon]
MYGILLEKVHPELPLAEVIALCETCGCSVVGRADDLVLVDGKLDWGRLALSKRVFKIEYVGSERLEGFKRMRADNFAVRTGKKALDIEIAKKIKGTVNLGSPKMVFIGVKKRKFYFGRQVFERGSFESRKGRYREYSKPISIHPKFARCLVNLARVRTGQRILDPFCGTGGILIEASMMGLKAVGYDIDPEMVEGTKTNLRGLGLKGVVLRGDARRLTAPKVNAIVTDPPYGRSSSFTGSELKDLYRDSLKNMAGLLKNGGYLAIICPAEIELEKIAPPGLKLAEKYYQRVHKSLAKNFYVFRASSRLQKPP